MKGRLPSWFKRPLGGSPEGKRIVKILRRNNLRTVCEAAICPNRPECFRASNVTFMILGDVCTRDCRFCNVSNGFPNAPDPTEPQRVAGTAKLLGMSYIVITSVTRDDLPDGGVDHFARTVDALRATGPTLRIEILTPDFNGNTSALERLSISKPDVWGHNIEVVPRLYREVRPNTNYERSLRLLDKVKRMNSGVLSKSALILGVGETDEEIIDACKDLRSVNVDMVVLGQYLSPSSRHRPVERFYSPEEFARMGRIIASLGFKAVLAHPRARSSYRADELYARALGAGVEVLDSCLV